MEQLLPAADHLQPEPAQPAHGRPGLWSQRAENSGNAQLFSMVVIGGLVTIVPLIALFLVPQRYWRWLAAGQHRELTRYRAHNSHLIDRYAAALAGTVGAAEGGDACAVLGW